MPKTEYKTQAILPIVVAGTLKDPVKSFSPIKIDQVQDLPMPIADGCYHNETEINRLEKVPLILHFIKPRYFVGDQLFLQLIEHIVGHVMFLAKMFGCSIPTRQGALHNRAEKSAFCRALVLSLTILNHCKDEGTYKKLAVF